MKYKIGDRVRVIKEKNEHFFKIGDIVEINEVDDSEAPYRCLRNTDGLYQWLEEKDIAPLDYTWEDFLKAPIGTKITLENEEILVKDGESKFENIARCISYERLRNFYNDDLGKIIKIEEPTYRTVYEPTEQVEEMTLEEVCKELGRNIKIVRRKNYEF